MTPIRRAILAILCLGLLARLPASETKTFDGGAFTITLQLDPESWRVASSPDKNLVHFQHLADGGFSRGTGAEFYVFVSKAAEGTPAADLPAFAAAYLARKDTLLRTEGFSPSRKFSAAKGNPVAIGPHRLLRYDARTKTLSSPSAGIKQREEGVVYFLAPADFAQSQTAVVFTLREVVSDQPGSESVLPLLEGIIQGFAFKPSVSP